MSVNCCRSQFTLRSGCGSDRLRLRWLWRNTGALPCIGLVAIVVPWTIIVLIIVPIVIVVSVRSRTTSVVLGSTTITGNRAENVK